MLHAAKRGPHPHPLEAIWSARFSQVLSGVPGPICRNGENVNTATPAALPKRPHLVDPQKAMRENMDMQTVSPRVKFKDPQTLKIEPLALLPFPQLPQKF